VTTTATSFAKTARRGKLTLVLYGEKDTVKYKVSGGKLTLSGSGDTMVFTKRTGVYVSL
jgi:lipopolysaccharide export system protein LptA